MLPGRRRLLIHIGFPKTATTFIQHKVFAKSKDIHLIHRSTAPELNRSLIKFLRSPCIEKEKIDRRSIRNALNTLDCAIYSNENVTVTSSMLWQDTVQLTPDILANNLAYFRDRTLNNAYDVSILVTIRRQDHWLASRYAQSAAEQGHASHHDFERWVKSVVNERYSTHGIWVNYHYLITQLMKYFEKEKVYVLKQEDLSDNSAIWSSVLEKSTGSNFVRCALKAASPETNISKSLRQEDLIWNVRGADSCIHLTSELTSLIMGAYSRSNDLLNKEFGIDGSAYGYY